VISIQRLEIAHSLVIGPTIVAVDGELVPEKLTALTAEVIIRHCDFRSSQLLMNHIKYNHSDNNRDEIENEESLVLDDTFGSFDSDVPLKPAKYSNSQEASDNTKLYTNRRGSSLGVYGAFSEIKIDW
jgi:hypothetical protein